MSYFDEQCLQVLQGIERNLERIADHVIYHTKPELEKEIHTCETCAYNPPSGLGGKPCGMCNTNAPLYDCWRKKETNNDQT